MPVFSRHWDPNVTKKTLHDGLAERGPSIEIEIHIPDMLRDLLIRNNLEVPAPFKSTALIDTGASLTAVEQNIFRDFGLGPHAPVWVGTPNGGEWRLIYVCKLTFPNSPILEIPLMPVVGCDMTGFGHAALIGRDILKSYLLVYNGVEGLWTLAF